MFRQIGAPEIILILAVVILLFGARKLPELARGSGRALRIFRSEIKGLDDDDQTEEDPKSIAATEERTSAPEPERRAHPAD